MPVTNRFFCFECGGEFPDGAAVCPDCGLQRIPAGDHRAAAERGDPEAQFFMGLRSHAGIGVPEDFAEAEKWYRMAAVQGHAPAQRGLGQLYAWEGRVPPDGESEWEWSLKAARQGDREAAEDLLSLYSHGSIALDDEEAVALFRGLNGLLIKAVSLRRGCQLLIGRDAPVDKPLAEKWLRLAAELNVAQAQYFLGLLHLEGDGVPQDFAEAQRWFRPAAEQGDASAQFRYGLLFLEGSGVPQDCPVGEAWIRRAAEQGHEAAQNMLGVLYCNGLWVEQNFKEAETWFRRAAEQMLPPAQLGLGEMYLLGMGVRKDQAEAARLLQLSLESEPSLVSCLNHGRRWSDQQRDEVIAWLRPYVERGEGWASLLLTELTDPGNPSDQD